MTNRKLELKQRGKKQRKTKPVYLVIAEGRNKTETLYLSNFQKQGNNYSLRFAKAGSKTDAESLYKTMCAKWKELELSSEKGDLGFIILDIDNDQQKADMVRNLIRKNDNMSIKFIISNPTFEIWFLIHFKYTTKHFSDGNAVINELKKYIPDYDKNRDCFLFCMDKIQDAVSNSAKINEYFVNSEWPSVECNPRTDMGELMSLLIE
ncbi:MAG: RloB family protein [Butyrivibrio sp.]|nr:RloB family protein [Butyrivibrio sp.]